MSVSDVSRPSTRDHMALIHDLCDDIFAFGMLVALLFRDEQQGMKKPAKSFLLSNWK
jgi:hypothetical protein